MKAYVSDALVALNSCMNEHIDEALSAIDRPASYLYSQGVPTIIPLKSGNPLREVLNTWALNISKARDIQEAMSVLFKEVPGSRRIHFYPHIPLEDVSVEYELKPEFKKYFQTSLLELKQKIELFEAV